MYKFKREKQISFTDFNQPQGMQMNPDNRWVKKAAMIPWDTIEAKYAKLFPSHTGMPAKPLRMTLGSLLIQKQYRFPDEELVEQISENPYYQYFIGLPGYEDKIPFADQIYRNRDNILYCNSHGIRLSGKRLGRPKKDADSKAEKKIAYMDNTDRIEVERKFSLAKRKFGLGLLLTKREDTTKSSIVLSIIAMNIDRLAAMLLRFIRFLLNFTLSYGRLVGF
ncbi:MAG: transposase [Ruminococcus sp.]|nr:transposase [Ruminococcus sp.]